MHNLALLEAVDRDRLCFYDLRPWGTGVVVARSTGWRTPGGCGRTGMRVEAPRSLCDVRASSFCAIVSPSRSVDLKTEAASSWWLSPRLGSGSRDLAIRCSAPHPSFASRQGDNGVQRVPCETITKGSTWTGSVPRTVGGHSVSCRDRPFCRAVNRARVIRNYYKARSGHVAPPPRLARAISFQPPSQSHVAHYRHYCRRKGGFVVTTRRGQGRPKSTEVLRKRRGCSPTRHVVQLRKRV